MECLFIFLFGIIIGSFLNVCIYRIPRGESIIYPPSHCITCKNKLKIYHLIPVISYIFLKGKCSYCKTKISITYPLIEIFTGGIFLLTYIYYGFNFQFVKITVFLCFLIIIAMIDFNTTDIFFKTILMGSLFGIIFIVMYYFKGYSISEYFIGGLIGAGVISFIAYTSNGMGGGDAEMCFLCGLYLGWKRTLLMLSLTIILGGIGSMILICAKKKNLKEYIPLGPYIALGSIISLFWGKEIIKAYLNICLWNCLQ